MLETHSRFLGCPRRCAAGPEATPQLRTCGPLRPCNTVLGLHRAIRGIRWTSVTPSFKITLAHLCHRTLFRECTLQDRAAVGQVVSRGASPITKVTKSGHKVYVSIDAVLTNMRCEVFLFWPLAQSFSFPCNSPPLTSHFPSTVSFSGVETYSAASSTSMDSCTWPSDEIKRSSCLHIVK